MEVAAIIVSLLAQILPAEHFELQYRFNSGVAIDAVVRIGNRLGRLRGDFEKVQENFRVLGRHITNAQACYSESEKSLTRLEAKLGQIEQARLVATVAPAPPSSDANPASGGLVTALPTG